MVYWFLSQKVCSGHGVLVTQEVCSGHGLFVTLLVAVAKYLTKPPGKQRVIWAYRWSIRAREECWGGLQSGSRGVKADAQTVF